MAHGKFALTTILISIDTVVGVPPPRSNLYVEGFSKYPGYSGNFTVNGHVEIGDISPLIHGFNDNTTEGHILTWGLTGLDTACVANAGDGVKNGCGIHIHTGTSCASADDVGGHYYNNASLSEDPWLPVVYVAASDGSSDGSEGVEVITGLSITDIKGRVMVVHQLESGARIACGVIEEKVDLISGTSGMPATFGFVVNIVTLLILRSRTYL